MYQRNYAADNFVRSYFGDAAVNFSATGALALQAQLYLATLAAALEVGADISVRRSRNAFGSLTWMLNEIWPTGGWGSLEYGTVGFTPGQVIGGRWKPLHHFLADSLFTDQFGTCGADGRCLFKNDDALRTFSGDASLYLLHIASGASSVLMTTALSLPRGAGSSVWLCADGTPLSPVALCPSWETLLPTRGCAANGSDCVLLVRISSTTLATPYSNVVLLAPPRAMLPLPRAVVTAVVAPTVDADGRSINITVSAAADSGSALFVVLTTAAQGRFSTNAIVLPAGDNVVLQFLSSVGFLDRDLLAATLRVEHVAQYVH